MRRGVLNKTQKLNYTLLDYGLEKLILNGENCVTNPNPNYHIKNDTLETLNTLKMQHVIGMVTDGMKNIALCAE